MVAFLAVLALAQSPTVSFAADATTVGLLVQDLNRQTGQTLQVAPNVASEPLIVDFENRPLSDVLPRIAKIAGAEWVEKDGISTLSRPRELEQLLAKEERVKVIALIQKKLATCLKEVEAQPPLDAKEAELLADRYRLTKLTEKELDQELDRLLGNNPVTWCATRFLASADPSLLARIPVGERRVFSDRPTAMQQSVKSTGIEALKILRAQLKLMEAAGKKLVGRKGRIMNWAGAPTIGPAWISEGYGKTNFAVTRKGLFTFEVQLTMVGEDGRAILTGEANIPSYLRSYRYVAAHKGDPITVSEATTAFTSAAGQLGVSEASSTEITVNGKKIIAHFWIPFEEKDGRPPQTGGPAMQDPVRYDPMGVVYGGLLREVAHRKQRNLLVTLSDGTLVQLIRLLRYASIKTDGDVLSNLTFDSLPEAERNPSVEIAEDNDWMTVQPVTPNSARTGRISRTALKALLDNMRSSGTLSMVEANRFVKAIGYVPSYGSLAWPYITHVTECPGAAQAGFTFNTALPFVASLTPQQWSTLENGALRVANLTSYQQKVVANWVYRDFNYTDLLNGQPRANGLDFLYPLRGEPTEMFPNGVPLNATLQMERTTEAGVIVSSVLGHRFEMNLASLAYMESQWTSNSSIAEKRQVLGYLPIEMSGYKLHVRLRDDLKPDMTVQESKPKPGARYGSREALGEDALRLLSQYRQALDEHMRPRPQQN